MQPNTEVKDSEDESPSDYDKNLLRRTKHDLATEIHNLRNHVKQLQKRNAQLEETIRGNLMDFDMWWEKEEKNSRFDSPLIRVFKVLKSNYEFIRNR